MTERAVLKGAAREVGAGAGARIEDVITTASRSGAAKNAWCREPGVHPAELYKWRANCTAAPAEPEEARGSSQATHPDRKCIKEVQRDLLRKYRALAGLCSRKIVG